MSIARVSLPAALTGLLLAGSALAQQPLAADPRVGAQALFDEGIALADNGRWPEACKKFEASQALDLAVGTLLRLGDCYERVGRRASAWARFREAQSLAAAQGMTDRERIATLRAEALAPKLARLTIDVLHPHPPGLRVSLNGASMPRESWGSWLPLDPGSTTIEASAPGHVTYRRQLLVPERDGARLRIQLPSLEPQPEAPTEHAAPPRRVAPLPRAPAAPADSGYGARALGVSFAVVGGVGLGAGGVLALLSSRRNEDSLDECPSSPRLCSPRGVQLRDEATTLADTATISAAVGGGLLVTGVVVYVIGSRKSDRDRASVALSPEVSDGRLGLRARGRF